MKNIEETISPLIIKILWNPTRTVVDYIYMHLVSDVLLVKEGEFLAFIILLDPCLTRIMLKYVDILVELF